MMGAALLLGGMLMILYPLLGHFHDIGDKVAALGAAFRAQFRTSEDDGKFASEIAKLNEVEL